ncbi:hypothetical protein HHI36_004008, partial [Cryptolaemus montrouzieri]
VGHDDSEDSHRTDIVNSINQIKPLVWWIVYQLDTEAIREEEECTVSYLDELSRYVGGNYQD